MIAPRPKVMMLGKFYPPFLGGMETHLQQLAEGAASTFDVRVLVSNNERRTVHEVHGGNIQLTRAARWADIASAQLCPQVFSRIRRDDSAIVHLHLPNPPAAAAYLASGHTGRLIVTYHSDIVRQRFGGRLVAPLIQRTLGRAHTIIVSSHQYLTSSNVLSPHRGRCVVIPFGVPASYADMTMQEKQEASAIRARYGDRIVLAAGRLSSYKGFDVLIRAMRRIDGHLVLIGDGKLRRMLESEVGRCGLKGRVTMTGSVPSLKPYFGAADVFALPSTHRSEAFAIVQAEALASGVPVVNTALATGVPFVSPHGETGLTVQPGDENELAAAIDKLLTDRELRARMSAAARTRASTVFDLTTMTRAICDVYRRALTSA
jgi:glycosyltransferase involved in cell wall biosynthesis